MPIHCTPLTITPGEPSPVPKELLSIATTGLPVTCARLNFVTNVTKQFSSYSTVQYRGQRFREIHRGDICFYYLMDLADKRLDYISTHISWSPWEKTVTFAGDGEGVVVPTLGPSCLNPTAPACHTPFSSEVHALTCFASLQRITSVTAPSRSPPSFRVRKSRICPPNSMDFLQLSPLISDSFVHVYPPEFGFLVLETGGSRASIFLT